MRAGFFAYPWDLLDEGPEQVVEAMADRYRCNALMLNVCYHQARLLRPRAAGPKIRELPGAVAAFEPDPKLYSGGLRPVADHRLVEECVVQRAREACAERQLDLGLWAVGLHNSGLGRDRPDLCLRNCFGDVYTYSLCPAQREVHFFLLGLVADLCQFRPERILLEAVGYLGLRHWVHHEMFFSPWNEPLEMLLSLCFCPICLKQAEEAGMDGEALRERVARWAERWLNDEPGSPSPEMAQGETGSLLLELPGLYPFMRLRGRTISALVAELRAAARAGGTALEVIPASFHRPVSRAWLEGASLVDLARAADGLLVPAYHERAQEVAADLWWVHSLAPEAPLGAGLNVCSQALADSAAVTAQAQACRSAGCTAVYYFNYGLLSRKRLAWVEQANASLEGG